MALSRRTKLLLIVVVAPLLLVALLVAALFTPAVQTFAARKVLAGQGGEVERVSAGLGGAELRSLRIEQPGLKLVVPGLRADAPVSKLAGGAVEVNALVARDLLIELDPEKFQAAQQKKTPPAEQPAPGEQQPAKPFEGVLRAVTLPELRVDGIDIAGRLRVSGKQPLEADFSLRGGGLAAGRTGELVLKIEAKAGLGTVTTSLSLAPRLDAQGQLDALGAVAEALATSKLLAEPARLRAQVDIARAGEGETYALRLLSGETPLVELDTKWAPGAKELPGNWKLAVRDEDLAPFVLGLALPDFALQGGGQLTLLGTDRARVGGELKVAADQLENLGLPALGALSLESAFALEAGAEALRVENFSATVAGAEPVLALATMQPFSVTLATQAIAPADAAKPLAEVRLLGVPAAWLKAFVPDLTLAGPVSGAWTVRPEGEGIEIVSSQPLVAQRVSYASAGAPLVEFEALRVEDLRVKQGTAGLEATVGKLRVVAAGEDVLSATLAATQPAGGALSAKGELRALLAKFADQPVLRGQTRLSAGQATVNFEATVAEAIKAGAQLRLAGLRAMGSELPELALDAELARDASGVLSATLPLKITNTKARRVSDLTLAATVKPGGKATHVVAKLSGDTVHAEDFSVFALAASEGGAPAAQPAPRPAPGGGQTKPAPAPAGPPWAGLTGELELAIKRVVQPPGIEILNTTGRIELTPDAAVLETLATALGTGGTLGASGALRWDAKAKAYTLGAEVKGDEVAVGPLLKAVNPREEPKLEGRYDLVATVSGRGAQPGALAEAATAELKLTGKAGVIRAIDLETNKYARAGSAVSGLAGLAGLAGALSGNEELTKRAAQVQALNGVARALGNLAYDEIALEARLAPGGTVEIGKLGLLAPQLRLLGGGAIRGVAGRSVWESPLNLRLELGAKGELARQLEALRVLAPPAADAPPGAFAGLKEPLVFDGTLQKVGTEQVTRLLTRALGL